MTYFLWLISFFLLFGVLSYHRSSLGSSSVILGLWLIIGTFFGLVGDVTWFLLLIIAIPLHISNIRHYLISQPCFHFLKRIMPSMSKTEQEAIDAGTTWWEADLLKGQPDWHKLHKVPQARLSPEEQAFLDGPVETVCAMVCDWQTSHVDTDLSSDVWQYLKDNGFFALIIKKEYGGLEFSAFAQSRILQKLVGSSTVLAVTVGVPNSLGPGELLQHYGTKEQKDYYLPRLSKGKEIPCFALTSPEAGSDAGAIPDFGIVCKRQYQGEETLGIALTFNKRYITLAPVATLVGLAFKLKDPELLLGKQRELGITCALLDANLTGLDIGRRHFPLNVPFQNGPIKGDDVFIPLSAIIGGPKMAGNGWRMLVECLSVGRAITLPANAVGGVKYTALATGAYARIRRQFKQPIGQMEGVEEALGNIGGNAYLMEACACLSTSAIDLGEKPSVISAIVKYHLTERSRAVSNHAMDIHGGKGIMLGPNNYLGRAYQACPIAVTVEGANILTRNMIIFGQGVLRCHPYLLAEIEALSINDETKAIKAFDHALFGHIGFVISNKIRSFWLSFSNARFVDTPFKDETQYYYQQLSRFSAALAFLSDVSLICLGGALKRNERISARLGDILSYLYIGSSCLKRFHDDGRPEEDYIMLRWSMEECLYQIQEAIFNLLSNFPVSWIGASLKPLILPWGRTHEKPQDVVEHAIAQLLQMPSASRERIAAGLHIKPGEHMLSARLESALTKIIAIEPLYDKICKACNTKYSFSQLHELAQIGLDKKLINEEEAELFREAEKARLQTINVDDFDDSELRRT